MQLDRLDGVSGASLTGSARAALAAVLARVDDPDTARTMLLSVRELCEEDAFQEMTALVRSRWGTGCAARGTTSDVSPPA